VHRFATAFAAHPELMSFAVAMIAIGLAGLIWATIRRPATRDYVTWTAFDGTGGGDQTLTQVLPVLDDRTAELVVDPTLKAAEVAEMVAHVEHGAGSVASVAAELPDTKLRDGTGAALVAVAELEAYVEAETQDARLLVEGALGTSAGMWDALDRKLWAIAPWVFYAHDEDDAECQHCANALSTVSGEYRALTEHTQEIDRRQLLAMLAA